MQQIVTQNEVTMSSREMAEDRVQQIFNGTAPESTANELAFLHIGSAALTLASHKGHDIESMSAVEARLALDAVEVGRQRLKDIHFLFVKYPYAYAAIEAQLCVMLYAEATIIPCYLMANRDALRIKENNQNTYIVKHPLTGLMKIGRAINVEERVKALQTGAGAILSTIAVIKGDVERELHHRFAHARRNGEWFEDADGEITAFAASVSGVSL